MSDGNNIIEAPAVGVRVEVEKLKSTLSAVQSLAEQHTMAIMDFSKAHNGHVMATSKQVQYLAAALDKQQDEIKAVKDILDRMIAKLTEKGLM